DIHELIHRDIAFKQGAIYETAPNSTFAELEFVLAMMLKATPLFGAVRVPRREVWPTGSVKKVATASSPGELTFVYFAPPQKQEEKTIEVDAVARLSARIVDQKVISLEVDQVALIASSEFTLKQLISENTF